MTDQAGPPDRAPRFPAEEVMKIATGFMASKYLFAGVEFGLFEQLAGGPLDLGTLAERAGAPERTVRIVADALVALGLLTHGPGGYANSRAAQTLLAGTGPADLRPALRLYDRISYPNWMGLAHSVRTGEPTRRALSDEDQAILSVGVDALSTPAARALSVAYDFAPHRRLLDLGGGTGSFLCALLQRHRNLSGTLMDTKAVAPLALERLADAGVAGRAEVVAGDILVDELPTGHDAVLIANVLHLMAPERNLELLKRTRACVAPGGRLLVVDFITDRTRTKPLFAALMAGSFLTGYGDGDVYNEEEISGWLTEAGWRKVAVQDLAGAARLIVATTA